MSRSANSRRSFVDAWLSADQEDLEQIIGSEQAPVQILNAIKESAPSLRGALKHLFARLVRAKVRSASLQFEDLRPTTEEVTRAVDMIVAFAQDTPALTPSAFISYACKDVHLVRRLESLIRRRVRYWIDRRINPGDRWRTKILNHLRDSRVVVIVLTPESVKSDWVRLEAGVALGLKKKVIPAVHQTKCPEFLSERQIVDLAGEGGFERLAEILARICPN